MTKITESLVTQNSKRIEQAKSVYTSFIDYSKDVEKENGRWAILGLVALTGAYVTTGQIISGIF